MSNPFGRPIYWTKYKHALWTFPLAFALMIIFGRNRYLHGIVQITIILAVMFRLFWVHVYRARARAKRVAACHSSRGRVTEILDGSFVAAAQLETDIPSEAFVARFAIVAEDGSRVVVEPGPAQLIDLAEIHVGDHIEIRGPHTNRGDGTYRGTEPTLVYRGTKACPLALSRTE